MLIGNIYGWTGGVKGSKTAKRTNDLLTIGMNELELQEPGPKMLTGDFNGNLANFPVIQDLLDNKGWIDLGSCTKFLMRKQLQATCNVIAAAAETRRDFMIVNKEMFEAVQVLE